MKIKVKTTLHTLLTTCYLTCVLSRPQSYRDQDPEARFLKRRPNRGGFGQPCASFNRPGKGRTFFDFPVQHYDISYNYHYTVNCGGGNQGGGGYGGHPINVGGGGGHPIGVGGGGTHPINVGGGQGGGGLLGHKKNKLMNILTLLGGSGGGGSGGSHGGSGPTQVQSQTQNLIANFGHLGQGILGTVFPENGLFDGQLLDSIGNVGSSLGNHLSSIFGSQSSPSGGGVSNQPAPGGGGQNLLGGLFGGLFNGPNNSGGGGGSNGGSGGGPAVGAPVTTTEDPDDIIYNDEKPVYEAHDEVTELYSNAFRPSPRPRPGYYPNRYQSGNRNGYQQSSFYNEKFIGPQNYNRRYY